jgi:hypothetical protein
MIVFATNLRAACLIVVFSASARSEVLSDQPPSFFFAVVVSPIANSLFTRDSGAA